MFRRLDREDRGAGIFDDIRLIPSKQLEEQRGKLLFEVASGITRDPPHHFRWLKGHPLRGILISFMTDRTKSWEWLSTKEGIELMEERQVEAVLALRGMFACGLMEHCLCRRYRVDYGIDSRRGIGHRVAVPYRASDTPSERAEYAQPDTLILFTVLAYYHSGISRAELKEAMYKLLKLGPIAQKAEYNIWLESAKPRMNERQLMALDTADKLDPTSDVQLQLMHEVYRYNMAVIDFWLDISVFPRETMQFPRRLAANAFNLADNKQGNIVGFSGTKDNKRLLPLQVRQQVPNLQSVFATDGKMLHLVLSNEQVICLDDTMPLSSSVLQLAMKHKANALIDTGATMAGLSNQQVALQVLELLQNEEDRADLLGVVYFNKIQRTWMVMNRSRRSWPLGASPIHERDAFVYFDESRCRGADMKLRENATAVLTLSPFICKDKLMQGAGRMRKLDRGQRLLFVVPPDVVLKIPVSGSAMKSVELLQWVIHNTIKASAEGLPEWGSQGSYFCTTRDPRARAVDEILEVKDLYANSLCEQTVENIAQNSQRKDEKRLATLGIQMEKESKSMKKLIETHAKKYGADQTMIGSALGEECEREIEFERELEEEFEKQIPRQNPHHPVEWDFTAVLKVSCPTQLPKSAGIKHLSEVMTKRFAASKLDRIRWAICRIFVTESFVETVLTGNNQQVTDLGDFMRPIDAMLVFESDSLCLLLSEWEGDYILSLLQCDSEDSGARTKLAPIAHSQAPGVSPVFINLTFLVEGADQVNPSEDQEDPSFDNGPSGTKTATDVMNSPTGLSERTLAGLQLLAGFTVFGTQARKNALSEILPTSKAKEAALNLIALRGLQHMIPSSDLELLCDL